MEKGLSAPKPVPPRRLALCAAFAYLFLAPALSLPADTLVYRCTTPDGTVEFRQHACTDGATKKEITVEDRMTGWRPSGGTSEAKKKDRAVQRKHRADDRTDSAKAKREEQCWKKRQLLEEVNWKLRRGYKAGAGVKLRRKRRSYEDYITRYCD